MDGSGTVSQAAARKQIVQGAGAKEDDSRKSGQRDHAQGHRRHNGYGGIGVAALSGRGIGSGGGLPRSAAGLLSGTVAAVAPVAGLLSGTVAAAGLVAGLL